MRRSVRVNRVGWGLSGGGGVMFFRKFYRLRVYEIFAAEG